MDNKFFSSINKLIFFPPAILLVISVSLGGIYPTEFNRIGNMILESLTNDFGWFMGLVVILLFLICMWAAFSRFGAIKLGGPDAKPIMGAFSWIALSFTSAMAIGISFWGTAEPMMHFATPAAFDGVDGGTFGAAKFALQHAFNHWGFVFFSMYCGAGVVVAFAIHNMKLPYRCSSALYPLIGEKIHGPIGYIFEAIILFAVVGSISSSLGMSALQIGQGMQYSFGITNSTGLLVAIIAIMGVLYVIVACCKVEGFMKSVGNFNMWLYIFLLLFVLFLGPTRFIVENIITSFGAYIQNLPTLSTNLDPFMEDRWVESWSAFFWPWWLAACPPTGLFLVKLSRGRTMKQFVLVNMVFPSLFCILWMGTFGSAGIFSDLFKGTNIGLSIVEFGKDAATYELMKTLPLSSLTIIITLICAAISFNTKATSISYTLAGMTMKGELAGKEPPKSLIAFWGIIMAAFTIILLYTGGRSALVSIQTASVICGLPNAALLVFMCVGFIKSMLYCYKYDKVGTFDDPRYRNIVIDQIADEAAISKPSDGAPSTGH